MSALVDPYRRKISYLRISVTDRCNLRCRYCMPPEGIKLMEPGGILRYEELLRIARIAARRGITKIRITGGEPLVRRGIVEFIGELSRIEGIEDLCLTTNGVLLGGYARSLREAGLKRVNVSLDSLKRERFEAITGGDHLEKVLDGLEEAERAGLEPVKINVVVVKGLNDDEVADFALLTKKKPYHVRFIEYMPFSTGGDDSCGDIFVSAGAVKEAIEAIEPLVPVDDKRPSSGPARRFRFRGAPGEIGFISPMSEHFCEGCNRLRLTADGMLRTCLFSDMETDIKSALRSGASDDEIEELLFRAVGEKPKDHGAGQGGFKKCSRTMNLIGG